MDVKKKNLRKERVDNLRKLVLVLLDSQTEAYSLRPELLEITGILDGSQSVFKRRSDGINEGETMTPDGLAVSPLMAAMCTDDVMRTIEFIRGTYDAINDLLKQVSGRQVRVLYAGCGPYAPLAVPLMSIFTPAEVVFTLIDIHPESMESVKSIVNSLGFSDSVTSFETINAGEYSLNPAEPPDIILMEIMRVCLEERQEPPALLAQG